MMAAISGLLCRLYEIVWAEGYMNTGLYALHNPKMISGGDWADMDAKLRHHGLLVEYSRFLL